MRRGEQATPHPGTGHLHRLYARNLNQKFSQSHRRWARRSRDPEHCHSDSRQQTLRYEVTQAWGAQSLINHSHSFSRLRLVRLHHIVQTRHSSVDTCRRTRQAHRPNQSIQSTFSQSHTHGQGEATPPSTATESIKPCAPCDDGADPNQTRTNQRMNQRSSQSRTRSRRSHTPPAPPEGIKPCPLRLRD